MTSNEIARVCAEIVEILEIGGESFFRVIAYRNAAGSLEFLSENRAAVYATGGRNALEEIPGAGLSIADKIAELLTTGHLQYYEQIGEQSAPDPTARQIRSGSRRFNE